LLPTYRDDSLKARPTRWPLSLALPKDNVVTPPTSLPKSRVTADCEPEIRVG
jgi:hypothetical protein